MAILTPSSSSSVNRRHILFELHNASNDTSQQKGLEMGMILTDLNGLDLDARLDMSLFRGLIDGVRQDLGFTEGVDESRTTGSRSTCIDL